VLGCIDCVAAGVYAVAQLHVASHASVIACDHFGDHLYEFHIVVLHRHWVGIAYAAMARNIETRR
jgi:hypothetical protein